MDNVEPVAELAEKASDAAPEDDSAARRADVGTRASSSKPTEADGKANADPDASGLTTKVPPSVSTTAVTSPKSAPVTSAPATNPKPAALADDAKVGPAAASAKSGSAENSKGGEGGPTIAAQAKERQEPSAGAKASSASASVSAVSVAAPTKPDQAAKQAGVKPGPAESPNGDQARPAGFGAGAPSSAARSSIDKAGGAGGVDELNDAKPAAAFSSSPTSSSWSLNPSPSPWSSSSTIGWPEPSLPAPAMSAPASAQPAYSSAGLATKSAADAAAGAALADPPDSSSPQVAGRSATTTQAPARDASKVRSGDRKVRIAAPFAAVTRMKPKPKRTGSPGGRAGIRAPMSVQSKPSVQPAGVGQLASQGARRDETAARDAQLVIARVEPWSVMKFTFFVSIVAWVILFVAVTVIYFVLSSLNVFPSIEQTVGGLTYVKGHANTNMSGWFSAKTIIAYTTLAGAINVVLFTALATVGAVIYNLVTHLSGGIEITLQEAD